jgi:hypothetical protein
VKWLSQLVVEVRNERKRITIVGQAQTRQESPSEILVSEAARNVLSVEGRASPGNLFALKGNSKQL